MTSSYYFGHFRPQRTGKCASTIATRFMAVRARGAHPDRMKPLAAAPFQKGDLVQLHLERGEPCGEIVDVKKCPKSGAVIDFQVRLGKDQLIWRGVSALKWPKEE